MKQHVKYQIFVSSTYEDLIEERKEVTQALLETNCIPAGMELFPASSKEQWEVIKKSIDESDYYLVIIAGKYGSIAKNSDKKISYTEMEFDYAYQTQKPIIAMVHSDIESLPAKKVERTLTKINKLKFFRNKAQKGRVVKFWNNKDNLKSAVISSINNELINNPVGGWVKCNMLNADDERIYYLTNEEMGFEYEDLSNAHYFCSTELNSLRSTLRYYTERFSWMYGGQISVEPISPEDKLVDSYREDKSMAYTLRLAYPLGTNMSIKTGFVFHISNSQPLKKMFLSYDVKYNFDSPIKLWVKIPNTLRFTSAIIKYCKDKVTPTYVKSLLIDNENYIEYIINEKREKGSFYSLEWEVEEK